MSRADEFKRSALSIAEVDWLRAELAAASARAMAAEARASSAKREGIEAAIAAVGETMERWPQNRPEAHAGRVILSDLHALLRTIRHAPSDAPAPAEEFPHPNAGHGQRVLEALREAVGGHLARVTIDGEVWIRQPAPKPRTIADIQSEIGKLQMELQHLVCGDQTIGVSAMGVLEG